MRIPVSLVTVFMLVSSTVPVTHAQQPVLSPRDSVMLALDTNTISVNYGRPSMRKRTIMGGLVPWNKVWRTGANEATHLKTNFDMTLGGVPLMRGTYTLWTIPGENQWTIVLNKQTGQWGTRYDERQDYARFDVKPERLPADVETLIVALMPAGKTGGMMKLMWERTSISIPFEKSGRIRPVSPLDSAETQVAGKMVKVKFSKPFARGRKIWGVVVPWDSVWRTGANSATELWTETDLSLGKTTIPKGAYTLYSIPSERSLKLIVSKKPAGRAEYDRTQDLARIDMTMEEVKTPIDPYKMWFEDKGKGVAVLKLGWAERLFSVELKTR